ncbi:Threonylcarbamoyl-AMP synthase (EC [Olavius algarvensis associated proteobacterium Delta 3]|nr:Threonylcarbamoyl-AMP synthase (EC [Olavius algarvensis associated proteobacterium Delta 3]
MKDIIRKVDSSTPVGPSIREAAQIILNGGVVVFPTTGLYGMGAEAHDTSAIKRVFGVKKRPAHKPILILVPERAAIRDLVEEIPPAAEKIMRRFWPGGVTLIFRAQPDVSPLLTAGSGKIGVRLPAYPVAAKLVSTVGAPITGTSANLSGEPGASDVNNLPQEIIDGVDMVLDAGPLIGGPGSTVVDITADPPTVLREGALSKSELIKIL